MRLLSLGASLVFAAATVGAQSFEAGFHGGVSRISGKDIGTQTVGGTDRITLKDGWRFGVRMTINNWAFFGHEIGYGYNRTGFVVQGASTGTAIHQGFYNFLAYARPRALACVRSRPEACTSATLFIRGCLSNRAVVPTR